MKNSQIKGLLIAALVVQMICLAVLFATESVSNASNIAFWALICAGLVEVALAFFAKRKGEQVNG